MTSPADLAETKPETIRTFHGETVTVIPGRTVIVYKDGFLIAVRTFRSTHARDEHVITQKRLNRPLRTILYQYEVR